MAHSHGHFDRASVDLDESGQPVLEPKSPPDEDDYQEGLERKQCVVRLDYDLFQVI